MFIRPGTCADADTLADFQLRMAMETEGLRLDPEVLSSGVRAVLDDPSKGSYWVAEEDGRVIASLLVVPEWSDWRNGTVWWIHSLYVRDEYRRRGVFRALFGHLKRLVQQDDGLKGLRLYVDRRNARAQQAYEAMGMDGDHYRLYEWMK